jgi:hypothetical protein
MNIHHRPILDTKRVCELYSAKDGVPVTYVCTSSLDDEGAGPFIKIVQHNDTKMDEIRLDFKEIEHIFKAIEMLKAGDHE